MTNKESYKHILDLLPYSKPFLFVDELVEITENGTLGEYIYPVDSDFYKGHFKEYPVTPGVLLAETMAQIGVVCLGIYLMSKQSENLSEIQLAMTSSEVEYLLPVFPGEKVIVKSEKVYFRFGKLKCKVEMRNMRDEVVSKGMIAGMIKSLNNLPK